MRGRFAVAKRDADGFYQNALIGGDVTPTDSTHANAGLAIDATDNVTISLNGYWQELEGGGSYSAVDDERDYRSNVQLNVLNRSDFEYTGINAKVDVVMPSVNTTMTAIAAFDTRDQDAVSDGDFLPFDVVRSAGTGEDETTMAELRFDTEYSDRFSTLIGLFASREESEAQTAQTRRVERAGRDLPCERRGRHLVGVRHGDLETAGRPRVLRGPALRRGETRSLELPDALDPAGRRAPRPAAGASMPRSGRRASR